MDRKRGLFKVDIKLKSDNGLNQVNPLSPSSPYIPVAILAGGKSRRMGKDKALLPLHGRPLIDYPLSIAISISQHISVVISSAQLAVTAYQQLAAPPLVSLLTDDYEHCGPLGGLVTALNFYISPRALLLLPCDMPFLTRSLIESLLTTHLNSNNDATIAVDEEGRAQPLVGVYSGRVLPTATELIENDYLRLGALLELIRCGFVTLAGTGSIPANLNHPADLAAAGDLHLS
ncbi:MAG: molybdenum cofactor guanylyltransferase [Acidobacteria bacterium]|nr:molybdenum cofactor guanylyltransferase [Acidobacteriota bacterium]